MFLSDYWPIIQEIISKLLFPYDILFALIIFVLILLYALNKDSIVEYIEKYIEFNRKKINYSFKIALFCLFFLFAAYFIYDNFYSPIPPEDQLVVAISPFYYIDESGKTGLDFNTRDDLRDLLEEKKDLGIKVILLDNPTRDKENAKSQGLKVGAHLVVYGETKRKFGNRGEIKYNILPLPSMEARLSNTRLQGYDGGKRLNLSGVARFSITTDESITIVESLISNASSSIYTIAAFDKYIKSNYTSAITFFKSIKDYENDSSILYYIAACYSFNKNLNDSLQNIDKAIKINPRDTKAWYGKGWILSDFGRYEEALIANEKAIEINPKYADAWYNKGVYLGILERYEEALIANEKAIEINPKYADVWYNKGWILGSLGKYKEALPAYDKAIEINPKYADAWYSKGWILGNLGKYEEALIANEKAIEINPKYADAWYSKGWILSNLGRYGEANEAFERAHELDPTIEMRLIQQSR